MTRRVVTLPPTVRNDEALRFADMARAQGANLLELRTDLHPTLDAAALAQHLPLIVSERGRPVPEAWALAAELVDRPLEAGVHLTRPTLLSHHAEQPLEVDEALRLWLTRPVAPGSSIKHVEPLGAPAQGWRLLETQRRLQQHFRQQTVTVLAMGPLALPFRCVLAERNALDYVAFDASWSAAPGQRLLSDAVREDRSRRSGPRRAILGSAISGSRSPRIHLQPFDRIDLPPDAPVDELVEALRPFYAGFSITSPFKKRLARHVGAELEAINTLVRTPSGWRWANTDVDGAAETLRRLGGARVQVLGDGGATAAIRLAAARNGTAVEVIRHAEASRTLSGPAIWTWPDRIAPPAGLAFEGARVGIISYGESARRLAREIRSRGGEPVKLGAHWFIAQARAQRLLWEQG